MTRSNIKAAWTPQPGPQTEAIRATWCEELLFGGARGGGKSDLLCGDFLQDVDKYGEHWQGIIFRKTFTELQDLIQRRALPLFTSTGAKFRDGSDFKWKNGAALRFRHAENIKDVTNYQGHEYPWIGWDELGNYPTPDVYTMMLACRRWSRLEIPTKRVRATANPGGVGHMWIKKRWIAHAPAGMIPRLDPDTGNKLMFIRSLLTDNKILLSKDPRYAEQLKGVGSAALVKAWLYGDWDIVAGQFFSEFSYAHHVIEPFKIPDHWTRFVGYDHGSASPFSVSWFAVCDGTDDRFPRGALIKYREYYGADEELKGLKLPIREIAQNIRELEGDEKIAYRKADPAIFKVENGIGINSEFSKNGIVFFEADNTRLAGAQQYRTRLTGIDGRPMLYYFSNCHHTLRTIPSLQHDQSKPEDVDTAMEDHIYDSDRYALMSRPLVTEAPIAQDVVIDSGLPTFNEAIKFARDRASFKRGRQLL